MRPLREILGYLSGALLFVGGMPLLMWFAAGRCLLWPVGAAKAGTAGLLMTGGLALSIWTIVYMRRQGDGNPMDAFGHEMAPRTQRLMTDGPYRLNRNPMLTGTLIYLVGVAVWLSRWPAWLVWGIFLVVMTAQVFSEERRLRRDFGADYDAYCRRTHRFLPF